MTDCSQLDRRVEYQAPADTSPNNLNQKPRGWTTVGTFSMNIRAMQGREIFHAQQLTGIISHVIIARRMSGFQYKVTGRLKYQTGTFNPTARYFNIASVENEGESNEFVKMFCTEVLAPVPTS
jgi:head-tail adaptor